MTCNSAMRSDSTLVSPWSMLRWKAIISSVLLIESALRGQTNGHLLLAELYAKAGAVDEARAELDLLAAENPNDATVKELKASLDQATPSPIKTKPAQ
jgi:thioredoxin-like negative regulator of GroEL